PGRGESPRRREAGKGAGGSGHLHGPGHRARLPALPGHRQGGAERPSGREAHRLPDRHSERIGSGGGDAGPQGGQAVGCRGRARGQGAGWAPQGPPAGGREVRIHEVAKELGVQSKDILASLEEMGFEGRTASSTVPDEAIPRLRAAGGRVKPGSKPVAATVQQLPTRRRSVKAKEKEAPSGNGQVVAEAPTA